MSKKCKINRIILVLFYSLFLTLSCCHRLTEISDEEVKQEHTRNISVLVNGQKVFTTVVNGVHQPRISINLIFRGISYVVELTKNNYLMSPTYVEKIINGSRIVYRRVNQSQELCYYHGLVPNAVHSSAAFSTCEGIKGFFVLNNSTFHIKPVQLDSNSSLVGLYEIKKANNDHLSQWICGVNELKAKFNDIKPNKRVKRQIIPDSLDGKNVVELYVANDVRRLRYFNNDYNSLSRSTREIVNAANLLYQPVGFFIVLVGVEHWQTDQIEVVTDSSKTLSNWHSYRTKYILNNHYNDVGFLISRQSFDASVLGLANVGTMCSSTNSGGIMTAILDKSAVSGAILAHEIGHNFGLSHDAADCYCQSSDVSCIMSARASTDRPAMYFSACSKTQLRVSIDKGFDICLKDFPLNLNEHSPVCGNGILEQGEDCDCGRMPSDQCNPSCCNPSTCKLIGSAQCASGSCCEVNSCQLKQVNTQCRASIGPCDLPETCDGRSAFCPKNVYKHDGLSCSLDGIDAYCWKGMCRTHRSQCQELYGSSVLEGNAMCYQIYNPMGSINGWCSLSISDQINYGGCQQEDVMCGALQCNTNAASLVRYTNFVMQTNKKLGGFECKGSLLDYGSRVENPGMVPNGASCGRGKVCINSRCEFAQSILSQNPCPSCKHGVCTNQGTCHCDQGYWGHSCENGADNTETTTTPHPSTSTTTETLPTSTTTSLPTTTTYASTTSSASRTLSASTTEPSPSSTSTGSLSTPTTASSSASTITETLPTTTTYSSTTTTKTLSTSTTETSPTSTSTGSLSTPTSASSSASTTTTTPTTTTDPATSPKTSTSPPTSTTAETLPTLTTTFSGSTDFNALNTSTDVASDNTTSILIFPTRVEAAQTFPVGGIVGIVVLGAAMVSLLPVGVAYWYKKIYLARFVNRMRGGSIKIKPVFKVFSGHQNGACVPNASPSNMASTNNVTVPKKGISKMSPLDIDKSRRDLGSPFELTDEYSQTHFPKPFVPASSSDVYHTSTYAPFDLPRSFKPYLARGPTTFLSPRVHPYLNYQFPGFR